MLSFGVFAGPHHLSDRDYVRCRLSGRKATTLRPYVVSGKKVLISGLIRIISDAERPYLRCNVTSIELLGGGHHPLPGEVHDEDDEP
jgi:hypothetical protein